eukprot:1029369-Rhodomonas_salina.1
MQSEAEPGWGGSGQPALLSTPACVRARLALSLSLTLCLSLPYSLPVGLYACAVLTRVEGADVA